MSYYILVRASPFGYYRSGEGHGWTTDKDKATHYSGHDFAERDRANMSRLVRCHVECVLQPLSAEDEEYDYENISGRTPFYMG